MVADGVVVNVVEVIERSQRGSGVEAEERKRYPVVRFTTTRGQVLQFQAAQNSNPPHHRIGGSIRVLYDPAEPRQVKFNTWQNRWGEDFIFISTGLWLTVLYAAIYLLLRSGRLQLWAAKILSRGS